MALAHETMIGVADRARRGVAADPEDRVGIGGPLLFHADVMRPDADIVAGIEAEMPGDLAQILILGRAEAAIRQSDMEEPAE